MQPPISKAQNINKEGERRNVSIMFVDISDDRVEIFKLMGTCNWLIGKQKNAIGWWGKAIKEGERLGAMPELSHTYMEVGNRLLRIIAATGN